MYQVYCYRNFEECKFKWIIDKDFIKKISAFFGWDLFGNLSLVIKNQGLQLLLNFFFGAVINASVGIATTLSGVLVGFSSSFGLASKPQIIQFYSKSSYDQMFKLVFISTRITYYLFFLLSIPLLLEADFILKLWLHEVPTFTSVFCQLILIQIILSRLYTPLNDVIHATGKIKRWSFLAGIVNLSNVFFSFLVIKFFNIPTTAYLVGVFCTVISYVINVIYTKKFLNVFDVRNYFLNITFRCLLVSFLGFILSYLFNFYFTSIFNKPLLNIIVGLFINGIIILIIGLNDSEKKQLFEKVKTYI
jgi:O-antigen/teichoic acid export membrane protein